LPAQLPHSRPGVRPPGGIFHQGLGPRLIMSRGAWTLTIMCAAGALAAVAVVYAQPFRFAPGFFPASPRPMLGWVTLALGALCFSYVFRKRVFWQWPGELVHWRTVHVALGMLFLVSMFFHSGGKFGGGVALGLLGLCGALLATGLWGIVIQGWTPRVMTRTLQDPVYKSEMQNDIDRTMQGLTAHLEGRSQAFQHAVQRHILPALSITRPTAAQQRALYNRYDPTSQDINAAYRDLHELSMAEMELFYSMAEVVLDIIEIRRSQGYQRLLNQWLVWHIALTTAFISMIVAHVAASFVY